MDKKKLIYILSGVMGGIILLIVIIFIIMSVSNKTVSYENIEKRLKTATVSYLNANESLLPKEESGSITIDADTLESEKYIKPISKMVKEGVSCSAKVIVTKNGDNYLYSPILNCGEIYKTEKFATRLLSDNVTKESGDGLYAEGENYRFKGEYVDNYVSLDGKLWRIIDIDKDGYARIIYVDKESEETYIWDDRYNIDVDNYYGINNYPVSRIKETLTNLEASNKFISSSVANLAYHPICIGKRSSTNLSLNNNEECETVINNQLFSLPYANDYVAASIDVNCKTIEDESCENYNYLMAMSLASYTMTGVKEKSQKVYFITSGGVAKIDAYNDKKIRVTAYISNNALYDGGNGTKTNPYTLK